jgi:cytochrome bd-type quinol oxidase subunit 2
MNTTEQITTESPPKKADRWVLYLLLTLGVQFIAFTHAMIAKNPPRGEAYREQVIRAMLFTFLPFAWSVFLMIMRRTRKETVVAYLSLVLSLFELRGMIWLAENFYAV